MCAQLLRVGHTAGYKTTDIGSQLLTVSLSHRRRERWECEEHMARKGGKEPPRDANREHRTAKVPTTTM